LYIAHKAIYFYDVTYSKGGLNARKKPAIKFSPISLKAKPIIKAETPAPANNPPAALPSTSWFKKIILPMIRKMINMTLPMKFKSNVSLTFNLNRPTMTFRIIMPRREEKISAIKPIVISGALSTSLLY
jgi:hypothetical protein